MEAQLQKSLSNLTPIEALARLEALDKKRREEAFIRYWDPQPQQKAHFKLFTQDIKIFGVLGGNRSGKTEEGAAMTVAWALGKDFFKDEPGWEWVQHLPIPEPPNNIWIVGLDFGVLKNVIWQEKLRQGRGHSPLLPKDKAVVREVKDGDLQIFFANGSVITGKSADSGREKFQSASVDLIWIDEECDVAIFDECYQRTVDCGGKILLTLTPLTDISSGAKVPWVFDLYEDMKHGQKDVQFVQLSVLENPYVPDEEKVKLLEKWAGHPEERARLYGEFVKRSGLVYPEWDRNKHVVDAFRVPQEWPRLVSIDPAATGTTAVLWAAVAPNNDIFLYREYYERDLVVSEHAKNILARNGGDKIDIWYIDPTWARQRNAETHKTGLQLYRESRLPVRAPDLDEDYGLLASREYINATLDGNSRHPKVFVLKGRCPNFEYEIEHYVWDTYGKGESKGLSKEKPRKRNDHLMNAFQYLCATKPKGVRHSTPQSVDRRAYSGVNSYT